MNALTIPDLNLFNHRRMSPTKRDYIYPTSDKIDSNKYEYMLENYRDKASILNSANSNRALFSQNHYKQLAQTYLQQQPKLPSYPIQPYPYLYNIPSYLYPEHSKKQLPSQCDTLTLQKDSINTKKLHRHNYIGMKEQQSPMMMRQPRILKQPYLQATFRERKQPKHQQYSYNTSTNNNMDFNSKEGKNSKIIDKLKTHQSKDQQQAKIGPINNLIVSQKHQASIQTDTKPHPISHSIQTTRSQYQNQSKQSKANVQRILQEQKLLIQSMKMEFQRQNDFRFHVQDLQTTKNDYMDRSRELLMKLNELADDKRQFGFILKAFTTDNSKQHNVFASLQV